MNMNISSSYSYYSYIIQILIFSFFMHILGALVFVCVYEARPQTMKQ